ncbi:hypothetical protein A7E78_05690 [Syntrophotalea acetylenivorans]|uniref:DUF3102 domain-containing protein n=2 Tax=Syntrophotalea acetylenivorans TaxID=1842532 RepID=A0A1L3GT28_9BACT|nr:hypothetical protein A7E78_05690 [Syntrophotalea acetylenivorans]
MQQLDPASERYRVLNSARRFKSSWVELGEELLKVNQEHLYRNWGYESFEDYCSREVRIKKPTALKLTRAYNYLAKEEPQLLTRQAELNPLPDYRTVDLLRQARQEEQLSVEQYDALRKTALEQSRSHPTVLKQFKEMTTVDGDPQAERLRHCKSALSATRRLLNSLANIETLADVYQAPLMELLELLEKETAEQDSQGNSTAEHDNASQ